MNSFLYQRLLSADFKLKRTDIKDFEKMKGRFYVYLFLLNALYIRSSMPQCLFFIANHGDLFSLISPKPLSANRACAPIVVLQLHITIPR